MEDTPHVPTVALDSLGCKLNRAEVEELAPKLARAGYRLVGADEPADIFILNTCTVTHVADHKSRQMLRAARRRNPSAMLVAVGCYAQRAPQELREIAGVELVLGNGDKDKLISWLLERKRPFAGAPLRYPDGRRRAFIKVQDGCQNFCTYCIVPYVRSRVRSVPLDDVLTQVREKLSAGCCEVVLTGTEIGNYNDGGVNLEGLLRVILEKTDVARLRLSSLKPHHISSGLLELFRDGRLCAHFHLSLQSGCDAVLARMGRGYTASEYAQAVGLIRSKVRDVAITTDVIVGFPGEAETEFAKTVSFLRQMQFARIHVFPFSARPGTQAALMPQQVPDAVKRRRLECMLAVAKESARSFRGQFLGRVFPVLWEQRVGRALSGLTPNYIRVYAEGDDSLLGRVMLVKLAELYKDGVWGLAEKT